MAKFINPMRTRFTFPTSVRLTVISSFFFVLMLSPLVAIAQNIQATKIAYTVSMENPNQHYYHVSLTYSDIKEKSVELKLPVWTPGYYMIMDYARYVINFRATDNSGKNIPWEKNSEEHMADQY